MSRRTRTRLLPRCVATTVDGSQCGRRVADGTNPPICHVHAGVLSGQSHSPLTQRNDDIDAVKELRRLARSSDERVRLRAIDLLLELARKDAEKRERTPQATDGATSKQLLDEMTTAEREQVRVLIAQLREIQRAVYRRTSLPRPHWLLAEESITTVSEPREAILQPDPSTEAAAPHGQEAPSPVDNGLGPDEEYVDEM